MLEMLDQQQKLTWNQRKIVLAAIFGDMLDFFDYYLIGFVLAFIVGPWKLTYGESAIILLSSGVGAVPGAIFWGWMADRIGRRKVFIATVLNFSLATGILALTPDRGWIFLSIFRFFVGFGAAGLYAVDLPLVQEFVPTSKRGMAGGLVTATIPIGSALGAVSGAFLADLIGWRGLFVVGLLPAALTLLIRAWVPESPRWLIRRGRHEEARRSLAWALQMDPANIDLPQSLPAAERTADRTAWRDMFKYPRSLALSWLINLGNQTGGYGITLWAPTLFVLLLKVTPAQASYLFIYATVAGFLGRLAFSYLSDVIGRRPLGIIESFGAAVPLALAGYFGNVFIGTVSVFWLLVIADRFFGDGGYAIVGPYSAEVWPTRLRASGMGAAYGFGGLGKIIGPLGLALIVGSSDVVSPKATLDGLFPAMLYLSSWYLVAGCAFLFLGFETKGRSIEEIDRELASPMPAKAKVAS
jgi:MFS transporter, putative metabolite:H+ symporter